MELFLKAASAVLIALILIQTVQQKELSLALSMAAAVMVGLLMISYLEPVISFLKELEALGDLKGNTLEILLKITGIGILTQITVSLCKDSGNSSVGQALMLLGTCVILWLALPMFQTVLKLIEMLLGEL